MIKQMNWFKRGFQYDIRANAIDVNGLKAKPAIVVFAEDKIDAIETAIKELSLYGYYNITIDKLIAHK